MGPTVIAKALEGSEIHANLTVGSSQAASPYDIAGISQGMQSIGAKTVDKRINEIEIDSTNKIVTAPCYMMEASIAEVHDNIQQAIKATLDLV
jgi:enhancing lycopene biosynthesis protein 2